MNLYNLLRLLPLFPIALLFGCATPKSEDVVAGAEQYLQSRFGRQFVIFEATSTFNEGNMNPNGFRIAAAPQQERRELIQFDADYVDGALIPRGIAIDKLYAVAQQRLLLSEQMAERLRGTFRHTRSAVLPNILYPGKVSVEIELYQLPTDESQPQLFGELAKILGDFRRGSTSTPPR